MLHKRAVFALVFFSIFLSASAALSCDYCLLSQGISPLETMKGAGVRINERYSSLKDVYHGDDKVANPGAKEEYYTTEVTGFYGITDGLLVAVTAPFKIARLNGHLHVHSDGDVEAHPDSGRTEGLGDVAVVARYSFFSAHTLDSTTTVAGLWGVKLPTGKTNNRTDDGGSFLDAHLQNGTGSYDFLAGFSVSRSMKNLTLSGNLLAAITGDGRAGDTEHRFGNTLNYDITARYRVYPLGTGQAGPALHIALGLNGEVMDREIEDGVELANSGGHKIYLTPGVQFALAPHWIAEASYHAPVYIRVNGTQLAEESRAVGGITYLF